ncbi:MAG TPA: ABC transporter ATP-binding protein [Dermatophilaceae bacterium]|nr:ABC transporter ATP-binding protein [Dermatophilaceae bacterium]
MAQNRFPQLSLLWSFVLPHRRVLTLGLLLGLVTQAVGLATPMVTKWVLDTLGTDTSLTGPVVALLVLLLIGTAVGLVQWVLMGTVAERVVLDARSALVALMFRATVPAVTRQTTGELVTRVTSDTVLLREAASSSIVNLINASVGLVGTLVLMAVLDLPLLGLTAVTIAVVAAVFAVMMPGIAKAQAGAQEAVGRIGTELEGSLRAIRTVKASRAEDRQVGRILLQARRSMSFSITAVRTSALAWSVSWSGVQLAIILVLGFGAYRVSGGSLAVSSLIAFLLYAFQLMGPISELARNVTVLQSGIAAASRIREVSSFEQEAARAPSRPQPAGTPDGPVVELRDVVARYAPEGPAAVDGVTLQVPRRGHLAIVGPSGAGKTTLFSLMLRFLEPQGGGLLLDGCPYAAYDHHELRARFAYVEQETPVVPGTIRENLLFSHPDATEEEVNRALAAVHLADKVADLSDGLDTSLDTSALSGGQRQRLALARAILRMPDVLLLDEATAQVDGITEAAVQACIRECARQGTVVTIAHRLSTVVDADRIVVLESGRIRADGTHGELLERDELYRDLVHALRIGVELPRAVLAGSA